MYDRIRQEARNNVMPTPDASRNVRTGLRRDWKTIYSEW